MAMERASGRHEVALAAQDQSGSTGRAHTDGT
jgi:hypothetical protein